MTKDEVLKLLKNSGGEYVSGEKISRELNITRTAVWKAINSLRSEGFTISSATNKGYRLAVEGVHLSRAALSARKKTVIGGELHFFESVTSTFDKLAEFEPKEGLTVIAAQQTSGRGRLGRNWDSGRGGVYFSFMLLPPIDADTAPFITLICALAVQRALSEYTDCKIKWPNDIVCGGRKLCGILTKTSLTENEVENVCVGIGINVNNGGFGGELANATSLKEICGHEIDENKLFERVAAELDRAYYRESRADVLSDYKMVCANLGKHITVHYANGKRDIPGVCTDILPDGSMNVDTENGTINVNSGEVSVKGIYEFERK